MELSPAQLDVLTELMNIGVGQGAGVLNAMIDSHVELSVPSVRVMSAPDVVKELSGASQETVSAVQLRFSGNFRGSAGLFFPPDSAVKLVDILAGDDTGPSDLDELMIGTLTEVGNMILNGVMGSISNVIDHHLDYTIPTYTDGTIDRVVSSSISAATDMVIVAETEFRAEALEISGRILLFIEVTSFADLVKALDAAMQG